MTENSSGALELGVELLISDQYAMWHVSTQRECLRFLRKSAKRFSSHQLNQLLDAILVGPPREMFKEGLEENDWERIVDREIWLRLAKLEQGGRSPPKRGSKVMEEIQARRDFQVDGDRDEFPVWMESGWVEPDEVKLEELAKQEPEELAETLHDYQPEGFGSSDEVRLLSLQRPDQTINALEIIVRKYKSWPAEVWRRVLWGLDDDRDIAIKTSEKLLQLFSQAPDTHLSEIGHAVSTWLRTVIGNDTPNPAKTLLDLWTRVWNTAPETEIEESRADILTSAINDRSGVLAETLLNVLWARKPKASERIPDDLLPFFNAIAEGTKPSHIYGRVILASRLFNLFALDPDWCSTNLLPCMDCDASAEAAALWAGYLWSPRVSPDLGVAFKDQFLKIIARRNEIGDNAENLVDLFAVVCTELPDLFNKPEIEGVIDILDEEGLAQIVRYFERSAQAADKEQQGRIWSEKHGPWLEQYWPKVGEKQTPQTANAIAEYLCETGTSFGNALGWTEPYLQPVDYPARITYQLLKSEIPTDFPEETLKLMVKLIAHDAPGYERYKLRELLDKVMESDPSIRTSPEYLDLDRIA